MPFILDDALRAEYRSLFAAIAVAPDRRREVESAVRRIQAGRSRYLTVGEPLHIPWFFIGLLHAMEASSDFERHLHNGDSLFSKTVNVPSKRPVDWPPPSWENAWEISATDALTYDRFNRWHDWSLPGLCYSLELYNGIGYRHHGVHSPYLWAGGFDDRNHNGVRDAGELPVYTGGKYVRDGVWSAVVYSRQIGAAVLLRWMVDHHLLALES